MCRLFGMTAAPHRVHATFWLLDASDSLETQSLLQPDGVGLGVFDERGLPRVYKRPIAAYQDAEFAHRAQHLCAETFLAHLRFASIGALLPQNTHPFCQHGRLMAHNGVVEELPRLEAELGDAMSLVRGDTDSERLFALVTKYAADTGDVGAAMTAAARWVAGHLPLYALNMVLTTATDLWALRYPDTHELFVLHRRSGGPGGHRRLEQAGTVGTVRVRSPELAAVPAVVVASEPMDDDPGWRLLAPGELLHVGPDQAIDSRVAVDEAPRHQLRLRDLEPHAAASQRAP